MAKLKLLGGPAEDLPYVVISLEPDACPHNVAIWVYCHECAKAANPFADINEAAMLGESED